jgi:hypothetical protein
VIIFVCLLNDEIVKNGLIYQSFLNGAGIFEVFFWVETDDVENSEVSSQGLLLALCEYDLSLTNRSILVLSYS